jgi:hypothetical protein
MSQQISLKEAERKAFRIAHNDGLWDIFLGCFVLIFAIAPLLSPFLGDFWSSVVFLPFWGLVFLVIQWVRKWVVAPRFGVVKFGRARQARLKKFSAVMLVLNVVVLTLGFAVTLISRNVPGLMISVTFGMILLIGFGVAAYFLDFDRLYVYGLSVGLSPLVGEWLWTHGYAAHHGFPITFGVSAGIMIVVGSFIFVRLLRDNPISEEGIPSEEVRDDQSTV